MAITDAQFNELEERVTKLEGLTVKTSELTQALTAIEQIATAARNTAATLVPRMDKIERKVNILIMQLDPVLAGTTKAIHDSNINEVSSSSVTYVTKKTTRINRSQLFYFTKLQLQAELKVDGGTKAWIALFINGVLKAEAPVTSATYVNVSLDWDWSGFTDDTWYLVEYKLKVEGLGSAYNRALELYMYKPGVNE